MALWTEAHQAPLSVGFSRRENGWLPCPPPRDLHDPGIQPVSRVSPALEGRFFTTEPADMYNTFIALTKHMFNKYCLILSFANVQMMISFLEFSWHLYIISTQPHPNFSFMLSHQTDERGHAVRVPRVGKTQKCMNMCEKRCGPFTRSLRPPQGLGSSCVSGKEQPPWAKATGLSLAGTGEVLTLANGRSKWVGQGDCSDLGHQREPEA